MEDADPILAEQSAMQPWDLVVAVLIKGGAAMRLTTVGCVKAANGDVQSPQRRVTEASGNETLVHETY